MVWLFLRQTGYQRIQQFVIQAQFVGHCVDLLQDLAAARRVGLGQVLEEGGDAAAV